MGNYNDCVTVTRKGRQTGVNLYIDGETWNRTLDNAGIPRDTPLDELKVKKQSIEIKRLKEELKDDPAVPQCFPISGIIIYTLIVLILLRILFYVISAVVGVITGIIGTIASAVIGAIYTVLGFVGRIMVFIFSMIIGVIGLTASVLGAIIGFMGKIIGLILDILVLIYGAIFPGFSSAA